MHLDYDSSVYLVHNSPFLPLNYGKNNYPHMVPWYALNNCTASSTDFIKETKACFILLVCQVNEKKLIILYVQNVKIQDIMVPVSLIINHWLVVNPNRKTFIIL